MIVPRVRTPVPVEGLADALDAAHRGIRGWGIPTDAGRIAVAQLRLEHGVSDGCLRGVYGFNFGNHDASPAERADPTCAVFETLPEHEDSQRGPYVVTHVRRAYADLDDGLRGYWDTLFGTRYEAAYEAMCAGDPRGFVHALKGAGYFTADERLYLRAVLAQMPQ